MYNKIEENFQDNEVYIKVSSPEKKSATVDLYNSIRSRNIKSLQAAINNGADVKAILCIEKQKISPFAYLFTHGVLNKEGNGNAVDLNNNNGIIIRMLSMLINSGFDPLYEKPLSFIDYSARETAAGHYLITASLNALEKTPLKLKDFCDDKNNKWIMYAIENENNTMLSQFLKVCPFNDSNLPWLFDQDGSQQSMLIKALDTSNREIVNTMMNGLSDKNVNSVTAGNNFTLLDEILVSIDNLPSGRIELYTQVAQDLINKGAIIKEDRKYGSIAEKIILENKTNKTINPMLKNYF